MIAAHNLLTDLLPEIERNRQLGKDTILFVQYDGNFERYVIVFSQEEKYTVEIQTDWDGDAYTVLGGGRMVLSHDIHGEGETWEINLPSGSELRFLDSVDDIPPDLLNGLI
jgi:hypothetical protein